MSSTQREAPHEHKEAFAAGQGLSGAGPFSDQRDETNGMNELEMDVPTDDDPYDRDDDDDEAYHNDAYDDDDAYDRAYGRGRRRSDDDEERDGKDFEPRPVDVKSAGNDAYIASSPPSQPIGDTGVRRAAVFILSLEEDAASSVLRCLSDAEVRRVTAEIATLEVVDHAAVAAVIREFDELERVQSAVREGGLEQAERLLARSLPEEKAERWLRSLRNSPPDDYLDYLEEADADSLAACLADERVSIVALVLSHLSPARASVVLERFSPESREEILQRIAGQGRVNVDALSVIDGVLRRQLRRARYASTRDGGWEEMFPASEGRLDESTPALNRDNPVPGRRDNDGSVR